LDGNKFADLNFEVSKDGTTLLMVGAAKGHLAVVELMVQNKGIQLNRTDNFGVNAFWIAAFYGQVDIMNLLA
jgi:ankyrin repeat protein